MSGKQKGFQTAVPELADSRDKWFDSPVKWEMHAVSWLFGNARGRFVSSLFVRESGFGSGC